MNTTALDTKTRPEPEKTADELWFEARVYGQYGSLWERMEDSIALSMERAINSPLPANDDVRGALRVIRGAAASTRPGIETVEIGPNAKNHAPPWFKRDHLGAASLVNYWKTQDTFPIANAERDKAYAKMLKNLEKARQAAIISKTRSA